MIVDENSPISDEEQIEESETGTADEPRIPERFRGKSLEDIVDMYSNLEKDHSRLGNELGQNRKLVDKLLQAELLAKQPVATVEDELDWNYEPEKATKTLVNSEVGKLKSELETIKRETELEKFKAKYPSYESDASSPEFIEWVQKSQYRMNLFNKNVSGIDFAAASELLDGWNDYKSDTVKVKEDTDASRKKALRDASLEKGASGGGRKKTWSRAYIRHLRLNEPAKYEAHANEIAAAYREGRVTK